MLNNADAMCSFGSVNRSTNEWMEEWRHKEMDGQRMDAGCYILKKRKCELVTKEGKNECLCSANEMK